MTRARYKMELFVTIVNKAFQPLTAVTKRPTLDIAEVLDTTSGVYWFIVYLV